MTCFWRKAEGVEPGGVLQPLGSARRLLAVCGLPSESRSHRSPPAASLPSSCPGASGEHRGQTLVPCSNHAAGALVGLGFGLGGIGVLQQPLFVGDLFFRGSEGEAVHPLVFGSLLGTVEGEF